MNPYFLQPSRSHRPLGGGGASSPPAISRRLKAAFCAAALGLAGAGAPVAHAATGACDLITVGATPLPGSEGNALVGPAGAKSYFWELVSGAADGWALTGDPTAQKVFYTAGAFPSTATFRLTVVDLFDCQDSCEVDVGLNPVGLRLVKTANKAWVTASESVTYTYTVVNDGVVTLSNVTISDDNGTPGVPSDDFVVGTIPSLAAGASHTVTVTKALPKKRCAPSSTA